MASQEQSVRTIVAFNTATESQNKIHDDEIANKMGFAGGLVPGVDVYAYACAPALDHWGRRFLEHSQVSLRLAAPVFDGERVEVIAQIMPDGNMTATVESPTGRCALFDATVDFDRPGLSPNPPPDPEVDLADRPWASPELFESLSHLPSHTAICDRAEADQYLTDVRADTATADWGLVHPGWLLRHANYVLSDNVTLGPWIHVGSEINHLAAVELDEPVQVSATVQRHYEHKGHLFVVLDVTMSKPTGQICCTVEHTAIYEPRQLRQASQTDQLGQP